VAEGARLSPQQILQRIRCTQLGISLASQLEHLRPPDKDQRLSVLRTTVDAMHSRGVLSGVGMSGFVWWRGKVVVW